MNLFVYGSLMFPEVWDVLIKNQYQKQPARLTGFSRKKIFYDVYPVAFKSDLHSFIDGMIYFSVSEADLVLLDLFEGDYYQRQAVSCEVTGGEPVDAVIYEFKPDYQHLISQQDWSPAWFKEHGLPQFLAEYKGF